MNCNDCLHKEVCAGYEVTMLECKDFADKSLYIKLPCKVGNEIFRIVEAANGLYAPFVPALADKVEPFGICYRNLMGSYSCIPFDEMGKTVFLSREEAEAALKEREK